MKKKEIIIISIFVIIMIAFLGAYKLYTDSLNKIIVQVVHNNEVIIEFDPDKDAVYKFTGSYGHMEVEVKDGMWRVTNEECPNHICSGVGWVSKDSYIPIICIPNEVYVAVKPE
ncbi:MAG: NusG domain II-containing protein [Erysipelotrichaceae bacterium]|jgi:hypothetical protein|nr:NusG domain II-containing protein [Bacillota bacterium]NLP22562.1 hypothetical protein [Erysipelotrichaceae bacterium]